MKHHMVLYSSRVAPLLRYNALLNILSFFLCFLCLFFIKVNANDLQPQLTVTLLENQQRDDCQYSGEVLFEADYRLPYADTYILLVTTSIDGDHYSPLTRYELEGRRGHLQIPVDAGECLQDIQIAIPTL